MTIETEARKMSAGIASNGDVRALAERKLIDRIFMGDYQEKRYVSKLNTYKDLIVLNKHEKILCDDLAMVKNQMLSNNSNAWFGFTEPMDVGAPAVYCVWTTLDDTNKVHAPGGDAANAASIVFGEYWFQVKSLRFGVNSMELHVTMLRPIDPNSSMATAQTLSSIAQQALEIDTAKVQQYVQENIIEVDWIMLFNQWKTSTNQKVYRFFSTEINWMNFVQGIRLLGSLSILLVTFLVHSIHWLGEFTLRLVSELSRLIKACTPIVLGLINLLNKIVGGLYILLAMMWRDTFGGNKQPTPRVVSGYSFNSRAPITYRMPNRRTNYNGAFDHSPYSTQYN